MTSQSPEDMTPKAHHLTPEMMTLEEIKEQLALYNRLYSQKRRHEKYFMEIKRASAIRYHRRKKLDKLAENGEIDLKDIDYEAKEENDVKATKPTKYKNIKIKVLSYE